MRIFINVFILLIVILVVGYIFLEQRVEKEVITQTVLKCPFSPYNFSASYLHPSFVEEFSPAIEFPQSMEKSYNTYRFWGISKLLQNFDYNLTLSKLFRHENYCVGKGCYHVIEGQARRYIDNQTMNLNQMFVAYLVEPIFLNMRLNAGFLPSVKVMPFKEMNDVLVNFVITLSSDLAGVFINQQLNFFKELHGADTNFRIIIAEFNPVDDSIKSAIKEAGIAFRYESLNQTFSRVKGLNTGGDAVTEQNEIIFFLDVDMKFSSRFVATIRNRVIQGFQVYFPVCFAEDGTGGGVNLVTGLGNVGMYKSDFGRLRWKKINDTVWGGEDDRLLQRVIDKGFKFYRNIEPGFIHVYHPDRSWKMVNVKFFYIFSKKLILISAFRRLKLCQWTGKKGRRE